jgi:hypothetical protein
MPARSDGGACGHFHMRDHDRGGMDLRRICEEMADRHLGRHGHDLVGRHADRDVIGHTNIYPVRDQYETGGIPDAASNVVRMRGCSSGPAI